MRLQNHMGGGDAPYRLENLSGPYDSLFLRATITRAQLTNPEAFMSVSNADRRQDKQRTLCRMLAAVGDRYLIEVAVEPTDKEFEDVFSTTWRELLDDGLVDDEFSSFGSPAFRLTAAGWLRAMLVSGTADTAERLKIENL